METPLPLQLLIKWPLELLLLEPLFLVLLQHLLVVLVVLLHHLRGQNSIILQLQPLRQKWFPEDLHQLLLADHLPPRATDLAPVVEDLLLLHLEKSLVKLMAVAPLLQVLKEVHLLLEHLLHLLLQLHVQEGLLLVPRSELAIEAQPVLQELHGVLHLLQEDQEDQVDMVQVLTVLAQLLKRELLHLPPPPPLHQAATLAAQPPTSPVDQELEVSHLHLQEVFVPLLVPCFRQRLQLLSVLDIAVSLSQVPLALPMLLTVAQHLLLLAEVGATHQQPEHPLLLLPHLTANTTPITIITTPTTLLLTAPDMALCFLPPPLFSATQLLPPHQRRLMHPSLPLQAPAPLLTQTRVAL